MKKTLFRNLIWTVGLSILFSELVFLIFYFSKREKFEALWVPVSTYFLGCLLLNVLFLVSSLPVFSLTAPNIYQNIGKRLLIYFSLPILVLFGLIFFANGLWVDNAVFIISGVTYIIIHTFFYLRLTKKIQTIF
jgi:hypothetical protein